MAAREGYDVSVDTIFVQGLPEDTTEAQLEEYFGQIGIIKLDKKNNCKKIWIYKDKTTGKGKGEATITYDDPPTATSAINWFNGKEFRGSNLKIELAQRKSNPAYQKSGGSGGFRGGRGGGGGGGQFRSGGVGADRGDRSDRGARTGGGGRPGDWMCPSCSNNNFAYRSECNRCRTPKPPGAGGNEERSHHGGGGGGNSRYHNDSRGNQRSRNGGGSTYRDRDGDSRGDYHQQRDANRDRSRDFPRDHNNRGSSSAAGNGNYRDRDDRNRGYGSSGAGGPSRSSHRNNDRRQRPY